MIFSQVGQSIRERYNHKEGTAYGGREFFSKVYAPLFLGEYPFLYVVNNSPFYQKVIAQKKTLTPDLFAAAEEEFHSRIEAGERGMSFVPADASVEVEQSTTGQVTNIPLSLSDEEVYDAWVGASSGIGVSGGLILLFFESFILDTVVEGWGAYRQFIKHTPNLKGMQVNTWNAWWLFHVLSENYEPHRPMGGFMADDGKMIKSISSREVNIETFKWYKLFQRLAAIHGEGGTLYPYVYKTGQTNTTAGYVPLDLSNIRHGMQLYAKLLRGAEIIQNAQKTEAIYDVEGFLPKLIQQGQIGFTAMEPKGLKQYLTSDKGKWSPYQLTQYRTWLMMTLNNELLNQQAQRFAKTLVQYVRNETKGRNTRSTHIRELWEVHNLLGFSTALTTMLEEDRDVVAAVGQELIGQLSKLEDRSKIKLFLSLTRNYYIFEE